MLARRVAALVAQRVGAWDPIGKRAQTRRTRDPDRVDDRRDGASARTVIGQTQCRDRQRDIGLDHQREVGHADIGGDTATQTIRGGSQGGKAIDRPHKRSRRRDASHKYGVPGCLLTQARPV